MNIKKIIFFFFILLSTFFVTDKVKASEEYVTGVLDEGSDAYNFISDTSNLPSTIHDHIFITNEGGDSYSESDNYVVLLTFSDKYRPYTSVISGNRFFSLFDNEKNYYSAKFSANYDDIDVYYLSYNLENNTYSWILQDNVQLIFYYTSYNYLKRYFNSTEYYKSDFTTVINTSNIDLGPKTPTIDVSITVKDKITIDNIDYITKKNIKLDFKNYDYGKYQFYLAFDYPREFCEYIPNLWNLSYSFNVDKNTVIYLKIIDRETKDDLYNGSITITDISFPIPSVSLIEKEISYLNNDTSLPPIQKTFEASFDYFDTEKYIYKYYYPDYDSTINMLENNKYISIGTNGDLIFYVYDILTGDLVYTKTFTITGLFGVYYPQISIKHNSFDYKNCGDEKKVYSEILDITFSVLDSGKYIYEYSMDNENFFQYDIGSFRGGFYYEYTVFSNSILYVRVKDKLSNEILDSNEYVIDTITFDSEDITCILGSDFNSNLSALQEYLLELKETSNAFNQIFNSFYRALPTVVSQGLAYAYIILLVIVGLKLGGWK